MAVDKWLKTLSKAGEGDKKLAFLRFFY